jgi:hypothetical protein
MKVVRIEAPIRDVCRPSVHVRITYELTDIEALDLGFERSIVAKIKEGAYMYRWDALSLGQRARGRTMEFVRR